MRRKITWSVETDMHGSRVDGEFYVDEEFGGDPPEEVLADYVRELVFQHVDWGWEEVIEEDTEGASDD